MALKESCVIDCVQVIIDRLWLNCNRTPRRNVLKSRGLDGQCSPRNEMVHHVGVAVSYSNPQWSIVGAWPDVARLSQTQPACRRGPEQALGNGPRWFTRVLRSLNADFMAIYAGFTHNHAQHSLTTTQIEGGDLRRNRDDLTGRVRADACSKSIRELPSCVVTYNSIRTPRQH